MPKQEIHIQYIAHSGYRVETEKYLLIFDYFEGNVSLSKKKTFVFSSHSHPDHYNEEILQWQDQYSDIKYVLSDDIPVAQKKKNILSMAPYQEIQLDDVVIKTFGSSDLGVSFWIQVEGIDLFHAGDLNWWYWWDEPADEITKAEKLFKDEIAKVKGLPVDIAFFPVDPRLEHNYCVGADYFIENIQPKYLLPMHFGSDFEVPKQYAQKMQNNSTKVLEVMHKGQVFMLSVID